MGKKHKKVTIRVEELHISDYESRVIGTSELKIAVSSDPAKEGKKK